MPWIIGPTISSKSFALLLAMSNEGVLGSPPLPDDFSLAMRIENATDPELGPGARATLVFDVRHFGPTNSSRLYVANAPYLVPPEPNQPIILSNAPNSECDFSAYEHLTTNPPGWIYVVTHDAPPFGVIQTCRVQLEVLEPARGGYQVSFFAGSVDTDLWFDPELRNNSVVLRVGGGQALNAVPVGGMRAVLMLSLGVVAAGFRTLAMRQPAAV
jgi:hypothetical protein